MPFNQFNFKTIFQKFKNSVGARTAIRVIREIFIPALLSVIWTIYSLSLRNSWNTAEAIQLFGGTFFILGYFANYFLRSLKLVKDEDRHRDVINQQKDLLIEMQTTAKVVASYATGGDSFATVWFAKISREGHRTHITELTFSVQGDYPLYDTKLRYSNMDDPLYKDRIKNGNINSINQSVKLGNIVANFAYPLQVSIPFFEGKTNRIHLNWTARNGHWYQRLELQLVDNKLKMATFVKRNEKEIYAKALTDYECDDNGRPKFDLSV